MTDLYNVLNNRISICLFMVNLKKKKTYGINFFFKHFCYKLEEALKLYSIITSFNR